MHCRICSDPLLRLSTRLLLASVLIGGVLLTPLTAFCERRVTSFPFVESFDEDNYQDLVWVTNGARHEWVPDGGWRGGGAAKFFPIVRGEGYNGLGQFVGMSTEQLNARFLIRHGSKFNSSGLTYSKVIIFNRNGYRERPMIGGRQHQGWRTYAPCDNTVCQYEGGFGVNGIPNDEAHGHYPWWPNGHDRLRIGDPPNGREDEWICVELQANSRTGEIKLYITTEDGELNGLYVQKSTMEHPGGRFNYIDVLGGYFNSGMRSDPDNYFIIDELVINDSYIGPPEGFLDGGITPEPQPAPEPDPQPAPEPDPQPAPEPDPQPAPEPGPEPAPVPDPEPAPVPDPAPVVDPAISELSENSYVVLNPGLVSAAVISLCDNNVITAGDRTLNLDLYERGAFVSDDGPALSPGMVVSGTGPFDIGSINNATDMPAHASMLGTAFAMPHARHGHIYYMVSPTEDASVQIDVDGSQYRLSLPQGEVVDFDAGETNGNVAAVITSDQPILVSHRAVSASTFSDASPVPPAARELWGVRSGHALVGAVENDTHVTLFASDDRRMGKMTLQAGEKARVVIGRSDKKNNHQGTGSAIRIVADKPVGAIQFADRDGLEQTAFYPTTLLRKRFGIPKNAQYIAIACPEEDTSLTLNRPDAQAVTKTCSADGNYPGKAYFGSDTNGVSIPHGSYLEGDRPIYAIYEVTGSEDEHNLMGTGASAPSSVTPIFSSGMEGASPTDGWMDYRTAESGGGATITFPSDGDSRVARFNYRAGHYNEVWLRENFGSHGMVNDPPIDELWINFEYKVSDTSIFNPNTNRASKILLVNWSNPDNNRRTFQVGLGAIHNGSDHVLMLAWSQCDRETGRWLDGAWLGDFATEPIPENEKLYLQLHIRNSTDGEADGLVQLYNNGALIAESQNVVLNDSFGDHPDNFLLTPHISDGNGASDGYTQYDNVALYDSDPGPFRAP
jgi:hypothetical protein